MIPVSNRAIAGFLAGIFFTASFEHGFKFCSFEVALQAAKAAIIERALSEKSKGSRWHVILSHLSWHEIYDTVAEGEAYETSKHSECSVWPREGIPS